MTQPQSKAAPVEAAPVSYVAVVLEALEDEVLLAPRGRPATPVRARLALPLHTAVSVGDEVVALPCEGATVVIASLARRPAALRLADGTTAESSADGASLELKRADGTALLRYECGPDGTRLVVESDGVALRATRGALDLSGAAGVNVHGPRVTLRSDVERSTRIELGPEGVGLGARRIELRSDHYEQRAGSATVRSEELRAEFGFVHTKVERLETVATQIVQHARNLYQRVEELAQQRAGRMRLLVDGTLQVRAKRATTYTDEQYKVRAETIHLG